MMRRCGIAILLLWMVFLGCASQSTQWIELEGVTHPTAFYVHDGRFYVVEDGAEIRVYATDDFRLMHVFGEGGEGPGRFRLRPDHSVSLSFLDDCILVNSDGKISWFSLDGRLLKEQSTPRATLRYRPLAENRLIYRGHARNDGISYFTYMLCDSALNDIKEICRMPNDWQADLGLSAFAVSWEFYTENGRFYHSDRRNGLQIDVYDADGEPIQSIQDTYQPLPVTQAHRDSTHQQYRTSPYTRDVYDEMFRDHIHFPEFLPAIRTWAVNGGRVYVFTFQQRDGKNELRIYTTAGDFVKTCWVPLLQKGPDIDRVAPYAIGSGSLYQFAGRRLRVTPLD